MTSRIGRRYGRAALAALPFVCVLLAAARPARAFDAVALLQPGSHSAPAWGADPFLSPLADRAGWWGSVPWARGPWGRLEATLDESLTERGTGHRGRAHEATGRLTLGDAWDVGDRSILAALRLAHRDADTRWRSTSAHASMSGHATSAAALLRADNVLPGCTLQGEFSPGPAASRGATAAGVRVRLAQRAAVQASAARDASLEWLRTGFRSDAVEPSLNLRADCYRTDGSLRLPFRLQAEGSAGWTFMGPHAPRDTRYADQLEPRGHCYDQQASLACGPPGRRVLARWTRADFDAQAIASWGGQSFADLTLLHGGASTHLAAGEWTAHAGRRARAELERGEASGSARGSVESWPFASILVDLLGEQAVARVHASARWYRAHASLETPAGPVSRLRVGVDAYDVRPRVQLLTWQTVFLGLGVRNMRETNLTTTRVQLVALSMAARVRRGRVEGTLAVRQFVFAKSFRRTDAAGGGSPATSAGHRGGWPGGTRIEGAVGWAP